MNNATDTPSTRLPGWSIPMVGALSDDSLPCGACGVAVPRAGAREEEVPVQRADQRGNVKTLAAFEVTRCADCAGRRAICGAANERLAVAVELLGYLGDPDRAVLAVAGLTTADASEWPISGILFQDWVSRAVEDVDPRDALRAELAVRDRKVVSPFATINAKGQPEYAVLPEVAYRDPHKAAIGARAHKATTVPFGHVLKDQAQALRDLQARNRANAASAAPGAVVIAAQDAAHLLYSRAEHRIDNACMACGCRAQRAPLGARADSIWHAVYVPVSGFVRAVRRPGAQVGNLAALLCSACYEPVEKQGASIGEELAHALLPGEVYYGNPDEYAPGALAGALFAGHVLRARLFGKPEPAPSGARWSHLKPGGMWSVLSTDPAQERLSEMAAEAEVSRAVEEAAQAEQKRISVEIQRQAEVIAKREVKALGKERIDAALNRVVAEIHGNHGRRR